MKNLNLFASLFVVFLTINLFADQIFLRTKTLNTRTKASSFTEVKEEIPFIVKLRGPITNEIKNSLLDTGIELLRYIPDNSFMVRAESFKSISLLQSLSFVEQTFEYKPEYKFFPINDGESHVYTVIFFNRKVTRLEADNNILKKLAENPEVEFIEKFNPIVPMYINLKPKSGKGQFRKGSNIDLDGSESGIHIINAEAVYDTLGLTGKGQVVGMADTGLDMGTYDQTLHRDFQDAVKYGYNASLLNLDPTQWSDPMGHGTHVAGSIVGRGLASGGKIHGVAYGANIVVASFWSHLLKMMLVNPAFDKTFGVAFSKGTMVHSNSWGGGQQPGAYDEMARTFDQLAWDMPEMLMVFASGNSGADANKDGKIDSGSLASPGTAKNVLTVGASENVTTTGGIQVPVSQMNGADQNWGAEPIFSDKISDNENGLAMFSSRGPTLDGRIKPDVVAPGTNILSNKSQFEGATELWGAFNEDYVWAGGTSMATPITAGAAVLVREFYKREHQLRFISSSLVKATLINGAFDMYPGQFGTGHGQEILTKRPNSDEGWGRIDLKNTLVLNRGQHLFFDDNFGLSTGEQKEYEIKINGSTREFRATMAYTDFPGAASAGNALTNNLDMKVITPSGQALFPNNLRGPDSLNNVEGIDIGNPQNGTYKIIITAYNVPEANDNGKQPFSLVVSY